MGLTTADSPQFTAVNIGHATDTTVARVSAGKISVEGVNVVTISSTDELTNKTVAFGSNTVSGTKAQFNTACTDDTFMFDLVDDTTPQLGGELDAQANTIGFTAQSATGDGTTTIDWTAGNKFNFTFGAQDEVFTFSPAPSKPCNLLLKLVQDGVGNRVVTTWPATVQWPSGTEPTLSTGANAVDIVSFYFDGTNYYGQSALNFSAP